MSGADLNGAPEDAVVARTAGNRQLAIAVAALFFMPLACAGLIWTAGAVTTAFAILAAAATHGRRLHPTASCAQCPLALILPSHATPQQQEAPDEPA